MKQMQDNRPIKMIPTSILSMQRSKEISKLQAHLTEVRPEEKILTNIPRPSNQFLYLAEKRSTLGQIPGLGIRMVG